MDINEELHYGTKIISGLNTCIKTLRADQLKQNKKWDQERKQWVQDNKQWVRERKQWESSFDSVNSDKQKLHIHALELIGETKRLKIENTNLISQNIRNDLSLAKFNAKIDIKTEEIDSLRNEIGLLKGKLDLSQKDSLKKGAEIKSLKSKIVELALKISELERLNSEAISIPTIGGVDEKNTRSEEQSFISRDETPLQSNNSEASVKTYISVDNDFSKYLAPKKNMDQQSWYGQDKKIDTIMSDHTDDKITLISEESVIRSYASLPEVDTEIISKVSDDETNINETSIANMLDISIKPNVSPITRENVTPHLAQVGNYTSSPIKSHSQISVGGIEAMPIVTSALMDETPLQSNNSEASVKTYISVDNDFSKYLAPKKNMDQQSWYGQDKKIDTIMSDHTDDKITLISEESVIRSYASLPEVDTEIISKVSDDETNINETSIANMLDISIKPNVSPITRENVTPHLAQVGNYTSSPIKSHSQISVGGIEAMPIVTSALMSPLSAYMLLTLLIIAVM
ncbi:hypothetical protein Glove_328g102 [Diversispora epigaea]|uniref:Uncharacterized protein n=1 Tax=Diversispora epigaea TaxID=1348612 RepID=A0A397HT23_9GLOM|nr:hypothetical protein Glove_328g102 [Diversispora epigaea]